MINPAMHRHPAEAIIIGRIVVAFGEIEYMVCLTAAHAIDQLDPTLKALYRLRATSSRIEAADAFMAVFFGPSDLSADYQAMISAVRRCLRIRNQYAHCNWADHWNSPGVFFADLQESAAAAEGFEHEWKHVDVALLTEQEAFFSYTLDWLYYLDTSMAVRKGKLRSHAFPKPTERAPPQPHNPPLQHVPPWLDEDRKALHIARAQAALGGVPTPTPKQQALDAARAEKRARKQADRERPVAVIRSRPNPPKK